ncbi:hypothetical protein [Streptomyces sp. R08]|uniref:Uncharacterized protein n=1 Tax=Streptomyces sp. R08 TaxID=3238624 RepID=A0AB39LX90_9ACTN
MTRQGRSADPANTQTALLVQPEESSYPSSDDPAAAYADALNERHKRGPSH